MKNDNQKVLTNFKKAKSHIAKIIQMMEEDQYCIDLMQQNLAVIGLLRSAHQQLMRNHLNTCFKEAMQSKNEVRKQKMTKEILQVANLFNR
ncbi:MAG: metal-sensing transcriptional repressor [Candidatus Shapirobacteria bacterium]